MSLESLLLVEPEFIHKMLIEKENIYTELIEKKWQLSCKKLKSQNI